MFRLEQNVPKRQRSPSLDRALDRLAVKRQCEDKIPSEKFWDTLPRIHLTRRALAEYDRRNRQQNLKLQACEEKAHSRRRSARLRELSHRQQLRLPHLVGNRKSEPAIRRFARTGGPDLTSIRGYPHPAMSSRSSRPSSGRTATSRRSNPYDANYEMKLAQVGVWLTEETDEEGNFVMPANHEEIVGKLNRTRPSLSPSRFTEKDFQKFRQETQRAASESTTMQRVMSTIEGQNSRVHSLHDIPFNNIEPFDPGIAVAKPDQYDGALPHTIDHRVFKKVNKYIVPSTDLSRPAAPNFFIEGKSRMGRADVAHRQAAHNGAIGARGMMSLQSYPAGIPSYDSNARSFSNTYHDGTLKMYTTHVTAPRAPDDQPSYHMTQLKAFAMTSDSDTFRRGAAYYRNARDLAMEQRDTLIEQANKAARQASLSRCGERASTTSSNRTNSRSQERTHRYSPDTDTSVDELALDYPPKRSRTGPASENEDEDSTPLRRQTTTSRVTTRSHQNQSGKY